MKFCTDDVSITPDIRVALVSGCYLHAKIENRTTTSQRLDWISVELRHQNGICWV